MRILQNLIVPEVLSFAPHHCSALTNCEIALRAYERRVARVLSLDHQLQDWLEAETELTFAATITEQLTDAQERIFELSTEKHQARRQLFAMHEISRLLAESDTLSDAAPKLAQILCECLDWDVGVFWRLDYSTNRLNCIDLWCHPKMDLADFVQETKMRTFSEGVGLPGRVWASNSLIWVTDIAEEANFPRGALAVKAGLRWGIGFPISNRAEFVGVLEFFSKQAQDPDQQLKDVMTWIGNHISQYIDRRKSERRGLKQAYEYRLARSIQRGLLPQSKPCLKGFRIGGRSDAPYIVGGDCFDFLPFPSEAGETLGVLVADACGHGIGAALLASQIHAYLRALSLTSTDVAKIFEITNQCLCVNPVCQFVTAFYMRLDPKTRVLHYANAGHCPGYVLDKQGQTKAVLTSTGLPLGMLAINPFPPAPTVSLVSGDLVVVVTDGITEAISPKGELFGMNRVLRVVREQQHQNPDEILSALFNAVGNFCNHNFQDDLTAIIVSVEEEETA